MSALSPAVEPAADVGRSTSRAIIEASGLTRRFGSRAAVAGVDFSLGSGEALALFGPNGAGKTTLLRMLAGLLRPTSGEARIDGHVLRGDADARGHVGFISHQTMLYGALTARENVAFAATLHGVREARAAAERALDAMRILDRADAPVRALSRGMQQRVSIARATVHEPSVVLLDEPYTGLDAAGAGALTRMLESLLARGAALVLVTHNIGEGLALATHAAIMRDGTFARFDAARSLDGERYLHEYRALVNGDAA